MSRHTIIAELMDERDRQCELGFDANHDDRHSLEQWIVNLALHLGLAGWDGAPEDVCLPHDAVRPYDPARYRKQLVRLAAVAVAALEAFDRRHARSNGEATHAVLTRPGAPPVPVPVTPPAAGGDPRAIAAAGELWDAVPSVPSTTTTAGYLSREGDAGWARKREDLP